MSQENVEVVRQFLSAFQRGDISAAFEAMHPEIEWRGPEGVPEPGPYVGVRAVRDWLEGFLEAWRDWQVEAASYRDAGKYVLVELRHRGTAKDSGIQVSDRDFNVFEVRDGRITKWLMFYDDVEALKALGLRE